MKTQKQLRNVMDSVLKLVDPLRGFKYTIDNNTVTIWVQIVDEVPDHPIAFNIVLDDENDFILNFNKHSFLVNTHIQQLQCVVEIEKHIQQLINNNDIRITIPRLINSLQNRLDIHTVSHVNNQLFTIGNDQVGSIDITINDQFVVIVDIIKTSNGKIDSTIKSIHPVDDVSKISRCKIISCCNSLLDYECFGATIMKTIEDKFPSNSNIFHNTIHFANLSDAELKIMQNCYYELKNKDIITKK